MEKEEVKISVRELVEFILRSGDIDNRRGGWADKESLAKGTRIHKKIQRQMGAAYQAEVPLSCRFCYEDLDLLVEGRADGIEEKEDHVMVDEIKGVFKDLKRLKEYIYSEQEIDGKQIGIKNVRQRIKLLYGEEYDVEITAAEGAGMKISFKVPII